MMVKSLIKISYVVVLMVVITSVANGSKGFSPQQQKLINSIKSTLDSHLVEGEKWGMKYHFYRPGLVKYGPFQWLWDSAFHMISWSRLNVTNSILDLRTMLQKQVRKNSRVPEMIFWGKETWKDKLLNKLLLSDTTITDITQMPMLPLSLKRIYQASNKDKKILEEFLIKVIEYHEWWALYRQPDHDGLIVIIHPWESGLDASPMYDEALKVTNPQPTLKQLYPKFQYLMLNYKYKYHWKQNHIIAKKHQSAHKKFLDYFVIKEVGVNSVYTYGWKILADLSKEIGNQKMADYCIKEYLHFVAGLSTLFDANNKRFVSKYLDKDQYLPTRANTVQSLFPLLVPDLPNSQTDIILAQLQDPKHYHCDFPIPTVSKSDPAYNPVFTIDLMWRGPSWAAPNYFILEALRNLNKTQLFKEIGNKWINEVLKNSIWEMWNPETGKGYGVENLGMSTSVIDILYKVRELE